MPTSFMLRSRGGPEDDALPCVHGHPRQHGGLPRGPQVHPEEEDRPLPLPGRPRRLRGLPQRGHPEAPDAQTAFDRPGQPRQGRQRPGLRSDVQSHRRLRHLLDDGPHHEEELRLPLQAPEEPGDRPRHDHDLPRRALRRGLLHLRRVRRRRGLRLLPNADLLFRPHPLSLRLLRERTRPSRGRSSRATPTRSSWRRARATSSIPGRWASPGIAMPGPPSPSTIPTPGP